MKVTKDRLDIQTNVVDARGPSVGEWLLLGLSVAGAPLSRYVRRRLGRRGGYLLLGGCGTLFARDAAMIAGGAPHRLQRVPRFLLFLELALNGMAVIAGCWAWTCGARRGDEVKAASGVDLGDGAPGALARGTALVSPRGWSRVSEAAAEAALVVHAGRMAIYVVSPSRGRSRRAISTVTSSRPAPSL